MFARYVKPGGYARRAGRSERRASLVFWGLLLAVALAEAVTTFVEAGGGVVCHIGLLVGLLLYGTLAPREEERGLATALTLAPMIRILSLTLPLAGFPRIAWYPLVSVPLLVTAWVISRQLGLRRPQLGLTLGRPGLQALLAGGGLALGAIEYAILRPASILGSAADSGLPWWVGVGVASVSLLVFTGFNEEFIFRGLLQHVAGRVLPGWWGVAFVSVLFGALHIGYASATDVLFVTAVGWAFAALVRWGGSILGVTLMHGLTNITLFVIMPWLHDPSGGASWAVVVYAACAVLGAGAGVAALAIWRGRDVQARTVGYAANPASHNS